MNINFKTCTEEELWKFVATHLKSKGIRVGLEQAVLVAKEHPIKFSEVEKWCKSENSPDVFREFESYLK